MNHSINGCQTWGNTEVLNLKNSQLAENGRRRGVLNVGIDIIPNPEKGFPLVS